MRILVTGATKFSKNQMQELENLGFDIIFIQDEREKIDFNVENIEGVICNGLFLYNDIKIFEKLKFIQLTSAGLDRVPLEYIKEHDIKLYNARGVYSIPMAEWTILKILEIYKKSKYFYENQTNKEWIKDRNILELNGKTATIVGYGSVGYEVCKRLYPFDVKINVVDIAEKNDEFINKFYYINDLKEAMKNTDILILTLPLTKETEGIIDKEKMNSMKNGSILINIARGKIIKETDLIEMLKTEKFRGVALDVFEEEPLKTENELWNMENVIITPHNCFVGENNNSRLFEVIKNNIKQYRNEDKK